MSETRRYGEDDIQKIFERAGSSEGGPQHTGIASGGLTLAELQLIADEVGLSAARIAEAAATLDLPTGTERRNRLGMPISVNRAAPLARLPTDSEWDLLLTDLRSTFEVQGNDLSKGNIREWTDGSLFATIEPIDSGCRIRLGVSNAGAMLVNGAGIALMLAAAIALLTLIATNDLVGGNAFLPPIIGGVGIGAIVYNGKRLKKWAGERAAQMDHVVDRARSIVGGESRAPLPSEQNHVSTDHDGPQEHSADVGQCPAAPLFSAPRWQSSGAQVVVVGAL